MSREAATTAVYLCEFSTRRPVVNCSGCARVGDFLLASTALTSWPMKRRHALRALCVCVCFQVALTTLTTAVSGE